MKPNRVYYFLLAFYFVLLVLAGWLMPKEINWSPTFLSQDKTPYGNYVLYQELKNLFPSSEIVKQNSPFYNFYDDTDDSLSNFILITTEAKFDNLDQIALLEYVRSGNSVFIATNQLNFDLQDSLGIKLDQVIDLTNALPTQDTTTQLELNFTNPKLRKKTAYKFKQDQANYTIKPADSIDRQVFGLDAEIDTTKKQPFIALGSDKQGNTNFVKIPFGAGNFYVHSYPIAFSNYNMLTSNNSEYVASCFSYLPNNLIYWNEYYNPFKQQKATTPLRFILSISAYKWAYYLAILSLLFYMIFAGKREQRIIPILLPFKNLSLDFTKTVGGLYFQQGNHKDLAEKKMTYFLEKIRTHYFLPTNLTNDVFQTKLSIKSNVPIETIQTIFSVYFSQIREQQTINEQTLIAFNKALELFYNQSGLTNK